MVSPLVDPIELVLSRHDAWRERFVAERDRVADALAGALSRAPSNGANTSGRPPSLGLAAK